jgi:D-alanyl-lipoteichoic acid acyltransferase DltB (MBOAT superfamily)
LFGIELSPNFARPFAAVTFADFWTRWHISLSNWLRDYVYMPISRALLRRNPSIRNVPNVVVPPLVTMLASGLWHGGSLNMMIWGALHGLYLIGERIAGLVRGRPVATRNAAGGSRLGLGYAARVAFVFTVITTALAFFCMDADVALRFFIHAFDATGTDVIGYRVALMLVPSLWLDWMQAHHGDETTFDHWHDYGRAALTGCAVLLCFLMSHTTASAPFIYQAF